MSLWVYLFHHEQWEELYNCSLIDIDSVPLERRQGHSTAAYITIFLTTVYYLLYIPCIHSLWKHQKDGNPCYRLLFYAAIMDFLVLWSLGFMSGFLALKGAVFCNYPRLFYFYGIFQDCFFSSETVSSLVLSINRCLDILSPETARQLFEGSRIWFWIVGMSSYGLYWLIFVNPAMFNSIYFAYFFNPFVGYINHLNDDYHPLIHTLHDWIIGGGMPLIYIAFLIGLKMKMRGAVGGLGITRLQVMSFLQVLVLSILHLGGGFLYVIMQLIPVSESVIVLAQFSWFHIHGLPPIIFLVMNRTIRNDCILLYHRIVHPNRVRRMHGVTVLDPKSGLPLSSVAQNTAASGGQVGSGGALQPVRGAAQPAGQDEKE